MANLDLRGFDNQPLDTSGLDRLSNTLHQQRQEQRQNMLDQRRLQEEQEGKRAATSKFLTNYLDPKDHLTGTAYDPQIVSGLQDLLQQGEQLASKGADQNSILMALGPQVSKLNQYSTTAKLISQNIKNSVSKIAGTNKYIGYDADALTQQALKQAFYGPDGKLKDISSIDPNEDYVSMATKNAPELVTTGKGLDDFVAKTPMNENSMNGTTAYAGRSKQSSFDAKFHDWMTPAKDENGNISTDENGMPLPMTVKGTPMLDDKNQPIINSQTGKPYIALDKNYFNLIMQHNPDVADFIRGQVKKAFADAGAKEQPAEHSPQWDMMARHVLADELQTRDHSILKIRNTEKETSPAIKIELGRDPNALGALANYESAVKLTGPYSYLNPKTGKEGKTNVVQAFGHILNNDADFLQGNQENVNGRNVVDVTPYMPGGGLKSGRGEDEVFKQIYYDPQKRSILVSSQPKEKDAKGNKPISLEEVPEEKMGQFLSRIAFANGVDPATMRKQFEQMGYIGGKFKSPADYGSVLSQRLKSEQNDKIDNAIKYDSWSNLNGIETPDGVIQKVVGDRWTFGGNRDQYAVTIKKQDGSTKTVTFPTKMELEQYLKSGGSQSAPSEPTKGASGIQWK